MAGTLIKSFNRLEIPAVTVALGAVPKMIYGRAVVGPPAFTPAVAARPGDVSVMIQNRSTFAVEISTSPAAGSGFYLLDGHAVTFDVAGIEWDGGIYVVLDDGAGNAKFCICTAGAK